MKLQGQAAPRPMTHDLLARCSRARRTGGAHHRDGATREHLLRADHLQQNGNEIEVDSRPSDAIALAVRAEAPIYADDRVIEESAIEFERRRGERGGDRCDEFKRFLDDVTPDQFAVGEEES